MIKVGLRFVDTSQAHLQYAAQLGVDGGLVRIDDLPGITQTGRIDRPKLRELITRLEGLNMEIAGMELRRSHIAGVL